MKPTETDFANVFNKITEPIRKLHWIMGLPSNWEPSLTPDDASIVRCLWEQHPIVQSQVDIEASTLLSRKQVGSRLNYLRELGLVHRPHGDRGGEGLTERGKGFAKTLPPERN